MNENNDDRLRWALRGLRQDSPPTRDLWPGIAARIADLPRAQAAPPPRLSGPRRIVPWAMAASLLMAVGFAWQALHVPAPEPVIQREAAQLTRDYQGALAQFQGLEEHPELASALQELDRSAEQIRGALDHAPNTRFLLEQLRRTYAKRLALTQRAVMS